MSEKQTPKCAVWSNRTCLEKGFIIILILTVIPVVFIGINLIINKGSLGFHGGGLCLTPKCIETAAAILQKMDTSADPCDDFFKFACGNFLKTARIPDDRTVVSTFTKVDDKVNEQLRSFLEAAAGADEPRPSRLLKVVYSTCMNTTRIEEAGLGPIRRLFRELGGFPILEPAWSDRGFDWKKVVYRLRRGGHPYSLFFSLYAGTDDRDSNKQVLTISQPCGAYKMLKEGLNNTKVQAYLDYMVEVARIFGVEKGAALREMREVLEFEINFAKITVPSEERLNSTLEYNPMTIRELQEEFTTIPWLQFINNIIHPAEKVGLDETVIVTLPKFLSRLEDLLFKTHRRVLANVVFWKIVRSTVFYLPKAVVDAQLKYAQKVYGRRTRNPRWLECVWMSRRLNFATSSVYVRNHFKAATRPLVHELVEDIRAAFVDRLHNIGWMDDKTRQHALIKAERMHSVLGYPDEVLNETLIGSIYDELELTEGGTFLQLGTNMSLFDVNRMFKMLRQPIAEVEWESYAYTYFVNAYYSANGNNIELPAAVLQDAFYDADRPQYANYGSIGYIIGHEITHGFDTHGRQYDKDGNLVDWWEPSTNRTFAQKAQCIVAQYESQTVPGANMKINGVNTQGENIADNGGIKVAYEGYQRWLRRNGAEPRLPGLPFGPLQMFWIAAATNWCTRSTNETLVEFLKTGAHSPARYRVLLPFANSEYFAKDFGCPLGAAMNPVHKCHIW